MIAIVIATTSALTSIRFMPQPSDASS
jgi:hypothetical protein